MPLIRAFRFVAFVEGVTTLALFLWLRTTVASFVPFGTFLNDPFLKRREQALAIA